MLPKIGEKAMLKDVAYHNFTRDIMNRKVSESNITKLKMIKEFLEEEHFEPKGVQLRRRDIKILANVDTSFDMQRPHADRIDEKQNEEKSKKIRRQSLTSEARNKQSRESVSEREKEKEKEKSLIFAVPDRFKLNELLLYGGRHGKKTVVKQFLDNSLKMNSQLYTHRIL